MPHINMYIGEIYDHMYIYIYYYMNTNYKNMTYQWLTPAQIVIEQIIKWNSDLTRITRLVNIQKAMENGHRNSWFSH